MKTLTVCPTYGRIPFLNRMLASFLCQTYDDKHLVIVNDDKNVELCCDHELVTCINLNKKVLLPQKRNIGIGLGYYDLIFQHDDDDIFLPQRISNHVQKFDENPDIWFYRNEASYMIYGDEFIVAKSSPTACSYTQNAWYEAGGYRHHKNAGEDQEFIRKIKNRYIENDPRMIDFVYNMGGINYHATYDSDERTDEIAFQQLQDMKLVGGKYWIEPDYGEFNKFVTLDFLYKKHQKPLNVIHSEIAKIVIAPIL